MVDPKRPIVVDTNRTSPALATAKTRAGSNALIFIKDTRLVGAVEGKDSWIPTSWMLDGSFAGFGCSTAIDLVEIVWKD